MWRRNTSTFLQYISIPVISRSSIVERPEQLVLNVVCCQLLSVDSPAGIS